MAKDVIVVVQRDALPTEKESLDILLVSTTGEYPVDTYRDVASVEAVYGLTAPAPMQKSFARRPPCSIRARPPLRKPFWTSSRL